MTGSRLATLTLKRPCSFERGLKFFVMTTSLLPPPWSLSLRTQFQLVEGPPAHWSKYFPGLLSLQILHRESSARVVRALRKRLTCARTHAIVWQHPPEQIVLLHQSRSCCAVG